MRTIKLFMITILTMILILVNIPVNDTKVHAKSKWTKFDIRTVAPKHLTAKTINAVLDKKGKSAKVKKLDIGTMIMKESKAHGISPSVLFSMFVYETGWGGSSLFKYHNNTGGITCMTGYKCSGKWTSFKSVEESFHKKASLLSGKLYVQSGRVKLGSVLSRYASPYVASTYSSDLGKIMKTNLNQPYIAKNITKIRKSNHSI